MDCGVCKDRLQSWNDRHREQWSGILPTIEIPHPPLLPVEGCARIPTRVWAHVVSLSTLLNEPYSTTSAQKVKEGFERVVKKKGIASDYLFDQKHLTTAIEVAQDALNLKGGRLANPSLPTCPAEKLDVLASFLEVAFCEKVQWEESGANIKRRNGDRGVDVPRVTRERMHVALPKDFTLIDGRACADFLNHPRFVDPTGTAYMRDCLKNIADQNVLAVEREIARISPESAQLLAEARKNDLFECKKCAPLQDCGIVTLERLAIQGLPSVATLGFDGGGIKKKCLLNILKHVPASREESALLGLAHCAANAVTTRICEDTVYSYAEERGRKGHTCRCFTAECTYCVVRAKRGGQLLAVRFLALRMIARVVRALHSSERSEHRKALKDILPWAQGLQNLFVPVKTIAGGGCATGYTGTGSEANPFFVDREFFLVKDNGTLLTCHPPQFPFQPAELHLGEVMSMWAHIVAVEAVRSRAQRSPEVLEKHSRSVHYRRDRQGSRARETSVHAGSHASARPFI